MLNISSLKREGKNRYRYGSCHERKVSAGRNETDVSGCHNWVKEMGNRLWRAWLKGGSVTKSQRLNASASSFRSPEMWDRSNSIPDMVHNNVNRSRKWFKGIVVEKSLFPPASAPVLSVKDGILKGKRNPGELRLKMNKIAICANVSNEAMHFCMSSVTGIFNSANCWNSNFSLNQIWVPEGKRMNPPIWQIFLDAIASAAHSPIQSVFGRKHLIKETDWSHAAYIFKIRWESALKLRLMEDGSRSRNHVRRSDK